MAGQFVVNVEVVVNRDDKWLMIERSPKERHAAGMLAFPGGTAETDDKAENTLEECGRREVEEEVGLVVDGELTYIESKKFYSDHGRWVIDVVFLAQSHTGEPRAVLEDEVASVMWMTFDEIMSHEKTPTWIKHSLELAHNHKLKSQAAPS